MSRLTLMCSCSERERVCERERERERERESSILTEPIYSYKISLHGLNVFDVT